MGTINQMSDELLRLLFSYVDFSDLFISCKLVSKRWLKCINDMEFDELIISKKFIFYNCWFFTYKPINLKNLIQCNELNFFYFNPFRRHFHTLKYLKIYCYTNNLVLDFDELNKFEQLIHLELGFSLVNNKTKNFRLKLLNLEILKIDNYFSLPDILIIECCRLKVLSCFDLNEINFIQSTISESIEYLEVRKFNAKLKKLINLKVLRLVNISSELSIGHSTSRNRYRDYMFSTYLPTNLKKIHFNDEQVGDKCKVNKTSKLSINHFLKEKVIQKKYENLKIFLEDVELVSNRLLDDYKFDNYYLQFYYENYQILAERLPYFIEMNYNKFLRIFTEVPKNFFKKFMNIQKIRAQNIENSVDFFLFLSNCPNLFELNLYRPGLNQIFYDQLPILIPKLTHFNLIERIDLKLDYNFILNFKVLIKFETSQNVPFEIALDIMNRSKFVQDFIFNNDHGTVSIVKNETIINRSSLIDFYLKYDIHDYIDNKWSSRSCEYNNLTLNQLKSLCTEIELNSHP